LDSGYCECPVELIQSGCYRLCPVVIERPSVTSIREKFEVSHLNQRLVRKAGSIIGCRQDYPEQMVERRTLKKRLSILDNPDHPLHPLLQGQRRTFCNRLIQLRCQKTIINHFWSDPQQIEQDQ